MTWASLFERAEAYGVEVDDVRRALRERRDASPADAPEDGDDDDG
ncbi:hypothetical protein [Haloarchaeobius sp. HRN-SO-5]